MFAIEIMINIIEAFLVYCLLKSALPLRERRTCQCAGIFVIAAVVSVFNYVKMESALQIVLVLGIHIFYSLTCFSGSPMEKILWGCAYMVIASIAERIVFKMGILFDIENLAVILTAGIERYSLVAVYLVICAAAVSVLMRINNEKIDLPAGYQILLILFVCSTLICADVLSDIMIMAQGSGAEILIYYSDVIFMLILFMIGALIYLVRKVSRVYSERNMLALERKNEEYLQREYASHKHMLETMRELKHDYSNHLQVLNHMVQRAELQKAKNYVDDLQKKMDIETEYCNSGNEVLDVIISAKTEEAKKNHIVMDCALLLLKPIPLNEVEITSLFGNLLDNAIEANLHVTEGKRFISLAVKPLQEDISIVVRNRYDGNLRMEKGGLLSRKGDGDHGIGLKQVKRIVDASGGYFMWETKEDIFVVKAVLPSGR